eukprot:7102783-Pyramimonas_sp.AAC.1
MTTEGAFRCFRPLGAPTWPWDCETTSQDEQPAPGNQGRYFWGPRISSSGEASWRAYRPTKQ